MSETTLQRHQVPTIRFEDWDRERAHPLAARPGQALFGALVLVTALGALTAVVATRPALKHPGLTYAVVGLLDGAFLLALVAGACRLLQARRYHDAELRLERFPFLVGEAVAVRFCLPQALRDVEGATLIASFRCVQQSLVDKLSGNQALRSHAVFEETTRVPAAAPEVALAFEVPAGSPSTELEAWPHHYYELELSADAPGLDFHAIYLLPVYRDPSR